MQSRFEFLEGTFPKLALYGKKAEESLHHDNNISLLNLGRIGETIKAILCERNHVDEGELLSRGIIDDDILRKINTLTEIKTEAAEDGYSSDTSASRLMVTALELCGWVSANYSESRFAFLADIFPSGAKVPPLAELAEFGQEAEENLYSNTRYCLICLGDIGESLAYMLLNMNSIPNEKDQIDRIKMLVNRGVITKKTGNTLHALRMARNLAIHSRFSLETDGRKLLEESLSLCEWMFMFIITPGDIVRGRLHRTGDGNIAVNIGRLPGNVPADEIPEDFMDGEKHMFRVIAVDGGNIALSMRDINADPWAETSRRYEKYTVGQEVNVVIRRLTKTLGAVVELRDGLEARIPDQELGSNIYNRKKGLKYEVKARVKWFDSQHYPYMLLSVKDIENENRQPSQENDEYSPMPDSYFMDFCKTADAEDISRELQRGANIHAKNHKGMNLLMLAAIYNHSPEVISLLVDSGIKVNAKNYRANTALTFAAMYGTPEVVRTLIDKGADPEHLNADKRKALYYALNNKKLKYDVKTIELLGGEILKASSYAKTVKDKTFLGLCQKGTVPEILEALNSGVNVNVASRKSRTTALMLAAKSNNVDVVRALLANGAGVNIQNKKGDTALILASKYNTQDVVDALIEAGADMNIANKKGEVAVIVSAEPEPEPEPEIEIIAEPETEEQIQPEEEIPAEPETLPEEEPQPTEETLPEEEIPAEPETPPEEEAKPEEEATPEEPEQMPETETVPMEETSPEEEAEPEPETPPQPAPEPEPEHEEISRVMKMILQRDFLSICRAGNTEEITEAINAGVNVNSMNKTGLTALMFAARFNTPEAVELLLDAGADVSLTNDRGKTALDYARKNDRLTGTEALRQLEYLSY